MKEKGRSLRLYFRFALCLACAALCLYAYIDKQNRLIELRMAIPILSKETRDLLEENNRLRYEIERWENPVRLMEFLRKPEFSHLRYPYARDVISLPERAPLAGRNLVKEEKNDR